MTELTRDQAVAAAAAVLDRTGRALYDAVIARGTAGIDEIALATGLRRTTAAAHLDRLVEAGVLSVERVRRSGRSGPGAGRPAKLYTASAGEIVVSLPTRDYELMGDILATAIEHSAAAGTPVDAAIRASAHARGRKLAAGATLDDTMMAVGYEPSWDHENTMTLANCPFHRLVARHTELVCSANLALVDGIVAETRAPRAAELNPAPGRCCVVLRAESPQSA